MWLRLLSTLICFASVSALYADTSSATPNKVNRVAQFVNASNTFSFALQDTALTKDQNVVFSPYSIFTCLSMVYAGAKGETAQGIQKALFLPLDPLQIAHAAASLRGALITPAKESCGLQFTSANGLFANQDTFILSSFRELLQKNYQAEIASLNFNEADKTLLTINGWVSNETKGKIPKLLDSSDISSSTRLVLVNAAYFKGNWVHAFSPDATTDATFYAPNDLEMTVPMMEQIATFPYYESGSAQILSLPFETCDARDPRINCMIVLPKSSADREDLEQELSPTLLEEWMDKLESKNVNVFLPRFCLRNRIDLNAALSKMGMQNAFTDKADFSGVDGMRDLFLSKVVHEAFFSLNEAGVEAAAATSAIMNMKSAAPNPEEPIRFEADHPFYFFLIDRKSHAILFAGKILQPDAAKCL